MSQQEFLGIDSATLEKQGAYWTAREIAQQPTIWSQLLDQYQSQQSCLQQWLQPIMGTPALRIIMTGAGTSAYIGEALRPHLTDVLGLAPGQVIEAISTTDILSNPGQYLRADVPTLMISYGRSGNSPESRAAVALADQVIGQCWHLVISCNPEGALARACQSNPCYQLFLMPEQAHDKSFAMTSSFTSMMLATLLIFAADSDQFSAMIEQSKSLLADSLSEIKALAQQDCKRLVFLGSGPLLGIAREAALKCLELTAGRLVSCYESPLGFRHGPKSMVDEQTQILLLKSGHSYTGAYDQDLLDELRSDDKAMYISSPFSQKQLEQGGLADIWLAFPYILYCQCLAFYKALYLGISADNPCPSGEVNRVVQGVTLYPYEGGR
ncbi:SIS domain-containing protein [Lacimicrobium alkaliphilum]|uniref:SIS domain-containing protein n=1 Tax=Lacimicrobium alkaliphilum TaxID=1526571 RepID=A0A0U3B533_9ALTE|nr:SIS domain-containing protein [Lacimicrobium alkaliphilum]ALS98681.1 hypothetical protein AT746_10645 [Lacimicrobium alkaliphilum]